MDRKAAVADLPDSRTVHTDQAFNLPGRHTLPEEIPHQSDPLTLRRSAVLLAPRP